VLWLQAMESLMVEKAQGMTFCLMSYLKQSTNLLQAHKTCYQNSGQNTLIYCLFISTTLMKFVFQIRPISAKILTSKFIKSELWSKNFSILFCQSRPLIWKSNFKNLCVKILPKLASVFQLFS
jgi:hypothetical protein